MVVFYALFYKNLSQIPGCRTAQGSCFPELLANWFLALSRNTVYLAGLQAQPIVRHFGKVLFNQIRNFNLIINNEYSFCHISHILSKRSFLSSYHPSLRKLLFSSSENIKKILSLIFISPVLRFLSITWNKPDSSFLLCAALFPIIEGAIAGALKIQAENKS